MLNRMEMNNEEKKKHFRKTNEQRKSRKKYIRRIRRESYYKNENKKIVRKDAEKIEMTEKTRKNSGQWTVIVNSEHIVNTFLYIVIGSRNFCRVKNSCK